MNRSHLAVVAAIVASSYLFADEKKPERLEPITAASLNQRDVIGKIGVPLGHGATIEATVIDGNTRRTKYDQGRYLLEVTSVNGQPLEPARLLHFRVDGWPDVRLVTRWDEVDELAAKLELHEVPEQEIADWKQNYVGSKVKLIAYEEGYYTGMPLSLPKGTKRVGRAEFGFGFRTYLVVVQQLPLGKATPIQKGQ